MGLWSYPNPHYRDGDRIKELCDLLVICGDHVLVFSDKNIKFNSDKDMLTSWRRWENEAILKSIHQLRGAERIIKESPEKVM